MNSAGDYEVKYDGKWGVVTKALTGEGRMVLTISCEYDEIDIIGNQPFVYKVKSGSKLGVLDKSGKPLSDCIYDEIIEDDAKISNHIRLLFRKDMEWTTFVFIP